MATLPVKWYHTMMRGIPVVSGVVGKLVNFLDAVLVNGFGQVTANSASAVDGIVTIQMVNSETFLMYSVIEITGEDQLKGQHRVIESSPTYIKIALAIPNQTFSSAFFVKYAPLGWTKITPTTPANTALYKPVRSFSDFQLYINDNYNSATVVKLCRGAKDTNDLSNIENLIDYVPRDLGNNSSYWAKWYTGNANGFNSHFLIGDDSIFYLHWGRTDRVNSYNNLREGKMVVAGDILRYDESDKLASVIVNGIVGTGSLNSISSTSLPQTMFLLSTVNANNNGPAFSTFLGTPKGEKGNDTAFRSGDGPYITSWSGWNGNWVDWAINGTGLELNRVLAGSERIVRGEYPGIFHIPFEIGGIDDLSIEEGSGDLAGRLIMFKTGSASNSNYDSAGAGGVVAFDITGPWR